MIDYKLLGERIRAERKKSGRSQKSLADSIGVTTAFLGLIESGQRSISTQTLVSLCNELRTSPNYILQGLTMAEDLRSSSRLSNVLEQSPPAQAQPMPRMPELPKTTASKAKRRPARHSPAIASPSAFPVPVSVDHDTAASIRFTSASVFMTTDIATKATIALEMHEELPPDDVAEAQQHIHFSHSSSDPAPELSAIDHSVNSFLNLHENQLMEEEAGLHRVLPMDELLSCEQLLELYLFIRLRSKNDNALGKHGDLLSLTGPWGSLDISVSDLHDALSNLHPAVPEWTLEEAMEYLDSLLSFSPGVQDPALQPKVSLVLQCFSGDTLHTYDPKDDPRDEEAPFPPAQADDGDDASFFLPFKAAPAPKADDDDFWLGSGFYRK